MTSTKEFRASVRPPYARPRGRINIRLDAAQLVIENTSPQSSLDETKIFERFEKGKTSEGMGLGLTIARNICNNYAFDLSYSFAEPFHSFTVRF